MHYYILSRLVSRLILTPAKDMAVVVDCACNRRWSVFRTLTINLIYMCV